MVDGVVGGSFGQLLTDEQLTAIIEYVRSL